MLSQTGDHRDAAPNLDYMTHGDFQTTKVTVQGVPGIRQSGKVVVNNGLPPLQGATVIVYVFYDGTRTYTVFFDHSPDAATDYSTDFDYLVLNTLRFRAQT